MSVFTRLAVAAILIAPFAGAAHAASTGQFATDPSRVSGDDGAAPKGSRLLPSGGEGGDHQAYGLELYDRMGADLPDLPEEKPYDGPVDDAYGAYQRGYFEEAYEAALERSRQGDVAAETLIAEMVDKKIIPKNRAGSAGDWYRMAADSGDPAAMNRYGMYLIETGDDEDSQQQGEQLIEKAATAGDPLAAFNYATLIVKNNPGREGLEEALPWFEESAAAQVADAEYALSQIYRSLDDLPEEKRRSSMLWLARAADAGHDTAQLELGLALINGDGLSRNIEAGIGWLQRSALAGNPAAASKLAYIYLHGIGTPVDRVTAATFYLAARSVGLKEPDMEEFLASLPPEELSQARSRSHSFVRGY